MRRMFQLIAVAIVLVIPGIAWSQQTAPDESAQSKSTALSESAKPQDTLAEAARKARERKKDAQKPAKVFTNDDLPTTGGLSSVGEATADQGAATAASPNGKNAGATTSAKDEKSWHEKFAQLRHKLEQDQASLDVAQRELGVLNTQFYNDPNKAMQQQLTRTDINDKTAEIDKLKAQVAADQQAISDAQDDLRKSGGDPGWAQ
jgi:cytoskeletal protein RodZ